MKIDIRLSEDSILNAVARLRTMEQNLRWGVEQTIDVLTKDGADIAQQTDGRMAVVTGYMQSETEGVIVATGEAPVIAEFGAGDATMIGIPFENPPPVDVYPGSYSEQVGTGEYYLSRLEMGGTGIWHFRGIPFSAVQPRQGLYKAKEYVKQNAVQVAKGVIKL